MGLILKYLQGVTNIRLSFPLDGTKNGEFVTLQLNNGGLAMSSPSISVFNLKTNKSIDTPLSSNPDDYEFSDELKNQIINEAIKKYEIEYWGTGNYIRKKNYPKIQNILP